MKNCMYLLRVLVLLPVLLFVGNSAFSQAVVNPGLLPYYPYVWQSLGSTGTVLPPNLGALAVQNHGFTVNAAGDVFASTKIPFTPSRGLPVVVDVVERIPKASVVSALGRFAGRALPVLATGVALYDLATDLGYIVSNNPLDQSLKLQKVLSGVECKSGCYNYYSQNGSPRFPTREQACTGAASIMAANMVAALGPGYTAECKTIDPGIPSANVGASIQLWTPTHANGGVSSTTLIAVSVPPFDTRSLVPATTQDLQNDITNKTNWDPNVAKLARTTVDILKSLGPGESLVPDPGTVSGPASSVAAPPVVVTDTTNNTTSTTTSTNNFNYAGNTVTNNYVQNTTKVDNSTSSVVSNVTTNSSPDVPPPTDSAKDTDLGALPKLYTAKYPNGLAGVWTTQKAAMTSSPLFGLASQLMPSLASTGTCPSWMIPLDLGPWNYGSHDVAPPCWIWDFAKAIVILSALLLARALIFGG